MSTSPSQRNPIHGVTRRQVLTGGAALASALAFPAIVKGAAKDVIVGAVLPLTGPSAEFGQTTWRALQFACEIMNEQGGVKALGGAKLSPQVAETQSKPEIAAAQAQQLIERGASVLIGCNQSASTIVATQVAERAKVPFLTAYDIDPTITARGFKYTFRCSPLTSNFANDLLQCIKEISEKRGKPAKRLGILSENSLTGLGANKYATEAATRLGYEIVDTSTYQSGRTQSFAPYITKLKSKGVEVLVGHNRVADAVLIVRTAMELKFNPIAVGGILGASGTQEFVDVLHADAENIFATENWALELKIPGMRAVAERFEKKVGTKMDASTAVMTANVAVIWDSLESAKTADPQALREAIAATKLNPGDRGYFLVGGVAFTPTGDNTRASSLITQVQKGNHVPVWPASIAIAEAVYPKPAWS